MGPADAPHQAHRTADDPADRPTISVGQLAHELNSLLDGSLRTIGLALHRLESASGQTVAPEEVVAGLQLARDAMWQMAQLLERAMRSDKDGGQVLHRGGPLALEVPRILELVRPLAEPHSIAVAAEIAPEAEETPVGALWPILLNGLRNAVQACVRAAGEPGRVVLRVALQDPESLVVRITDNGPGPIADRDPAGEPQAGGHGLGLGLCRQLVSELGGRLTLSRRRGAGGAELRVEVPLRSLTNP